MSDIRQDHSRPSSPEEPPSKKAKNTRKKTSWTWGYFEEVDVNEQTSDKGEPLKRCKVLDTEGKMCGAVHVNDGSTGNAINHLLSEHDITREGKRNVSIFFLIFCFIQYT
jgi:hypothetical protein